MHKIFLEQTAIKPETFFLLMSIGCWITESADDQAQYKRKQEICQYFFLHHAEKQK